MPGASYEGPFRKVKKHDKQRDKKHTEKVNIGPLLFPVHPLGDTDNSAINLKFISIVISKTRF